MDRLRRNPRRSLGALGSTVVVLLALVNDELLHGYTKLGRPYLLHAALLAVLLIPVAAAGDRIPLPEALRGVLVSVGTLALLYLVAVGLMWYDLVHTPPTTYYTPPTLAEIAWDRFEFALLLAPLAAGYVVGTTTGDSSLLQRAWLVAPAVLLLACGPLFAYTLAVADGAHSGFTGLFYGVAWVGSIIAAGPFVLAGRWNATQG